MQQRRYVITWRKASAPIWNKATILLPTGHAIMDLDGLSDFPNLIWQHHVRRLVRQVGGRRYGVSATALDTLRRRLILGQDSTLGGCQFVGLKKGTKTSQFYVVRELGRVQYECMVEAGDDVIFAGCWRVCVELSGRLISIGTAQDEGITKAAVQPPDIINNLPFMIRRTIPVLCTLDGALVYPQIQTGSSRPTNVKRGVLACFLGHNNNRAANNIEKIGK